MESPDLWTAKVIPLVVVGEQQVCVRAHRVDLREEDGTILIVFGGIKTKPKHVLVSWNGSSIVSAIDIDVKLTRNPGKLRWNAKTCEIEFVANLSELKEVCLSQCFYQ